MLNKSASVSMERLTVLLVGSVTKKNVTKRIIAKGNPVMS